MRGNTRHPLIAPRTQVHAEIPIRILHEPLWQPPPPAHTHTHTRARANPPQRARTHALTRFVDVAAKAGAFARQTSRLVGPHCPPLLPRCPGVQVTAIHMVHNSYQKHQFFMAIDELEETLKHGPELPNWTRPSTELRLREDTLDVLYSKQVKVCGPAPGPARRRRVARCARAAHVARDEGVRRRPSHALQPRSRYLARRLTQTCAVHRFPSLLFAWAQACDSPDPPPPVMY